MHPVLFSIGPLTIYSFGLLVAVGFIAASFAIWKRGRENHLYEQDIFDAIFSLGFIGFLGARVVFILQNWNNFGLSYSKWLSLVGEPGMSFEGGLFFGLLALWYVSGKKRWDYFQAADIGLTGFCLAQFFGWIGAFFSGFGMGKESRRLGIDFIGQDVPRFPSQLVWSIGFLLIFMILWREEYRFRLYDWYKGRKPTANKGYITFLYFLCLGILTVIVAFFNENSIYLLSIARAYLTGCFYFILGLVGIYIRSGREAKEDGRKLRLLVGESVNKIGKQVNKVKSSIRNLRSKR